MNEDVVSLEELVARTGKIVERDRIFLLLEDPELAEQDIPHAAVAIWQPDKEIVRASIEHNAISIAVNPVTREIVMVGSGGRFTVTGGGKKTVTGTIREDYDFSKAAYADDSIIAVGIAGSVFRMTGRETWKDISRPEVDEILEAACSFPDGGFLVCGWNGLVAHYTERGVERCDTGSNVILTSLICDESGEILACGQRGTIVRGAKDALAPLDLEGVTEDFWSIARFQGEIYVASMNALYRLADDETLQLVKFEDEVIPTSFYHLDVFEDTHLLSVGMSDAVLFDGAEWTRIL